jgi:antitoxin ParD1/3/4
MNISLGKQLEKLVEQQVKSGIYQNNSEVVRDALRHMFIENDSDDTELLAESLRAAVNSPRKRYVRGEFQKVVITGELHAERLLEGHRLAASDDR